MWAKTLPLSSKQKDNNTHKKEEVKKEKECEERQTLDEERQTGRSGRKSMVGIGGGLLVSMVAFYSGNQSSNLAGKCMFSVKMFDRN